MRGHIHKRTKKGADGKPTTYWYVVVDVASTTPASDARRLEPFVG